VEALVISDIAFLDDYTSAFGEDAGARLAYEVYQRVLDFDGPVFILGLDADPERASGPRRAFFEGLKPFVFEKNIYLERGSGRPLELDELAQQLRESLRLMDVEGIIVNRFWFDRDRRMGGLMTAYLAP